MKFTFLTEFFKDYFKVILPTVFPTIAAFHSNEMDCQGLRKRPIELSLKMSRRNTNSDGNKKPFLGTMLENEWFINATGPFLGFGSTS